MNQTMVSCDEQRCPYSTPLQTPRSIRTTRPVPSYSSNITPLVNRAPVICNIGSRSQLASTILATAVSLDLFQKREYLDIFNWPTVSMLGTFFIQTQQQRNAFFFSNVDMAGVNTSYYSGPDFIYGVSSVSSTGTGAKIISSGRCDIVLSVEHRKQQQTPQPPLQKTIENKSPTSAWCSCLLLFRLHQPPTTNSPSILLCNFRAGLHACELPAQPNGVGSL